MLSRIVRLSLLAALIGVSPALAAFNDIITGARPQGMGGAFVAVADDVAVEAVCQPAGGRRVTDEIVGTGRINHSADIISHGSGSPHITRDD